MFLIWKSRYDLKLLLIYIYKFNNIIIVDFNLYKDRRLTIVCINKVLIKY